MFQVTKKAGSETGWPELGCVKAEGCSASFACSVEVGKKNNYSVRLVRVAKVLCGQVLPAD